MLHREILRYRSRLGRTSGPEGNDWTRFVTISDEEIDVLMRESGAPPCPQGLSSELLGIEDQLAQLIEREALRVLASTRNGVRLPLVEIANRFDLSTQEQNIIGLCLAPELDRRYERVYGYLHDDMTRRRPSVGLVLDLCSHSLPERIAISRIFEPESPLIRYRLIQIIDEQGGAQPLASRLLKLDNHILSFIIGKVDFDPRVRDALVWIPLDPGCSRLTSSQVQLLERLLAMLEVGGDIQQMLPRQALYFHGGPTAGAELLAQALCRRLGVPLIQADAVHLITAGLEFRDALPLALRESRLLNAAFYLKNIDQVLSQDPTYFRLRLLERCLDEYSGLVILAGEKPWSWPPMSGRRWLLPIALQKPDHREQLEIWRALLDLADVKVTDERDLARLVSLYCPSAIEIETMLKSTRVMGKLGNAERLTVRDIERSCREQRQPDFGPLARRLEPKFGWQDVVLPERPMQQLREICTQAKYRSLVYGCWGFDHKLSLGKGLTVLFAGPSGTGKTMSAEIIAQELSLDLYKIDLSQVISKYIGETEKNLHQLFQAAETGQAILFFDEADAMLGKRSEVQDAHDRYANIEVAYLLQKVEEYEGITILATNLRQNIDEAFVRRIRFIVEFPFPEEEDRLRIWQGVWPREAPLAADIDLEYIARQFRLAGGSIRNIAVAAAFLAMEEGGTIQMRHLLHATKREMQKMGRLVNEEEYSRNR